MSPTKVILSELERNGHGLLEDTVQRFFWREQNHRTYSQDIPSTGAD